jgi:hypothetical protein
MAKANKISTTAMSTNRAKVCIYLLSPLALDLPFDIAEAEVDDRQRGHRICSPNHSLAVLLVTDLFHPVDNLAVELFLEWRCASWA